MRRLIVVMLAGLALASCGASVALPEGYPQDLPPFPGATAISNSAQNGSVKVSWETSASCATVFSFYQPKLNSRDFKLDVSPGSDLLVFHRVSDPGQKGGIYCQGSLSQRSVNQIDLLYDRPGWVPARPGAVQASNSGTFGFALVLILLILVVVVPLHFLPTIVALYRKAPHLGFIILLNLFGATVIPWIIALVMAFRSRPVDTFPFGTSRPATSPGPPLSPDGRWYWAGDGWRPMPSSPGAASLSGLAPRAATLHYRLVDGRMVSLDGTREWDGTSWRVLTSSE
jgi:hypothetical protein